MALLRGLVELSRHPDFRRGVHDEGVLMPGMLAWGLVSGVALVKGGLSVGWSLTMALLVYSAGAQLGAVAMMASGAPLWIIVAATVCVNLRFVIFSAGLRPYLVHLPFWRRVFLGYACADLSYIVFMQRYGERREPQPGQIPYLIGCCITNWVGWQSTTVLGILFADAIPGTWGLGYAGVLALLGLSVSLITDRKAALAACAAFATALLTHDLPLRLNVVCAIAAAVWTGVSLERMQYPAPQAVHE